MKTSGSRFLCSSVVGLSLLVTHPARPCTTFLAEPDGQPVVGKNYDWNQNAGLVVMNPRGLRKSALTLAPQDTPLSWTAKYASLTFNQYGVEFPNGGLNEKGLTAEILWLDSSVYPAADSRPAVNELQWIQHALDEFATVDELATAAAGIRVARAYANVHYLVCDAGADCAAFEYLSGELVVTRASAMPAKTLANDTYADSANYLANFQGFGGDLPTPSSTGSLDRFVRASIMARTTQGTSLPTSAFQILESVAQSTTQWSIVYLPKQGTVHFRTRTTPSIKTVSLASFAVDCPAPPQVLDIDTDLTGDAAGRFLDYTNTINRQLLTRSMTPLATSLPAGAMDLVAGYPETCTCVPPGGADSGAGGASASPGVGTGASPSSAGGNAATRPTTASSDGGCSLVASQRGAGAMAWVVLLGLCVLARSNRRRALTQPATRTRSGESGRAAATAYPAGVGTRTRCSTAKTSSSWWGLGSTLPRRGRPAGIRSFDEHAAPLSPIQGEGPAPARQRPHSGGLENSQA